MEYYLNEVFHFYFIAYLTLADLSWIKSKNDFPSYYCRGELYKFKEITS